jgi:hypothetical protein
MELNIKIFKKPYRGFQIGCTPHHSGGFRAAWKSSLEKKWTLSNTIASDRLDAKRLAKVCIDFNCKVEAEETNLGRDLTIDELKLIQEGKL